MKNLEQQLKKARRIHGNKYDYSKACDAQYTTSPAIFICPIHGEFQTTWDSHISRKSGCPKCSGYRNTLYTTEEWVELAKKKHKDKYDYSETEYTNAKTKLKIICHEKDVFGNEHGEFYILPPIHLKGVGCPICGGRYQMTTEQFVALANLKHKNKYIYNKTVYTKSNAKVIITCPEHGDFEQTPSSHLSGAGCPKCKGGVAYRDSDFIKLARKVHGDYYDYSHLGYVNAHTDVTITCPIHGDFKQIPYVHLRGNGCPKCGGSMLEKQVISALNKNNIDYIFQYKLKSGNEQRMDFYLPDQRLVIECQGEQHFHPSTFGGMTLTEAEIAYDKCCISDKLKYQLCCENNINVVYFTIPKLFTTKDSVNDGFYEDKYVVTSIDELIGYIRGLTAKHTNSIFRQFARDIKSNVCDEIVVKNNLLTYHDFVIIFRDKIPCERNVLNDLRRSYSKRNKKVIIVFYDEYLNNKNIIYSKIRHVLGLNKSDRIYGRNCGIQEINGDVAKSFLKENHIQSYGSSSSVYLGAYHNGHLIAVMTFLQDGKKSEWNLTRFATDKSTNCIGVGGKLFSYFIKHYEYRHIKSFADKRWTYSPNNNLYTHLGFDYVGSSFPDYRYIKTDDASSIERIHKFNMRKTNLIHRHPDILHASMTESEMTEKLGYSKIWDCGLYKYVYTNPLLNQEK